MSEANYGELWSSVREFLLVDVFRAETLLHTVSLCLIGTWFLRELTGVLPLDPVAELALNSVTLLAALLVVAVRKAPVVLRPSLAPVYRGYRALAARPALVAALAVFVAHVLLIARWDAPYNYHPGADEFVVPSMHLAELDLEAAVSNPNASQNPLFENQHVMYYVLVPFFALLDVVDVLRSTYDFFLAARLLNYAAAVGVVATTHRVAEELYDRRVALLAVGLLLASRQFALYALFVRPDVLLTLVVTALVYCFLRERDRTQFRALLVGALVGLGAAFKPYALAFVLPFAYLLVTDAVADADVSRLVRESAGLFSAFLVVFHAGRFYHNYATLRFGSGFRTSIDRASTATSLYPDPGGPLQQLAFTFTLHSWWNGLLFAVAAVVGLAYVLATVRRPASRVIALFVVPFVLLMGVQVVQSGRYFLPVLPLVATAVAAAALATYRSDLRIGRVVSVVFVALLVAQMAFVSLAWTNSLTTADPRTQTADWIEANVEEGAHLSYLITTSWQRPRVDESAYRLHPVDGDTEYLVVATSDFHRVRYYAAQNYSEAKMERLMDRPERKLAVAAQLFDDEPGLTLDGREYRRVTSFEKTQRFAGVRRNDYHPHPASWDVWAVTNPKELIVYRRVTES